MPFTKHARARLNDHVAEVRPRPPSGDDTPAPLPDGCIKLTRPISFASERALKKNRSEIAAASKLATQRAVKAAFLSRLEGKKFEGNLRALGALERFVDACAAKGVPKEHLEYLAAAVVGCLGRQDIEGVDMEATITAAIAAGMSATFTCLFDGPSIDFPLGNGETVKVLVREGTTISSRDSPLFGHSNAKASEDDGASKIAAAIAGRFNPLALITGAAGSGKTVCGISVVAHLHGCSTASGACLRVRCGADWFTFSPDHEPCVPRKALPLLASRDLKRVFDLRAFEETYKSAHGARDERDLVAQHFVLQAIDKVITWHHRKEPTEEGYLVVFLDDAGEYPTFVRAMCSRFDTLQSIISARYSNGKCLVRIIMAGTVCNDTPEEDHRVGSEHPSIFRYSVQPRVGHVQPGLKSMLQMNRELRNLYHAIPGKGPLKLKIL
jgi:hypothetical protein